MNKGERTIIAVQQNQIVKNINCFYCLFGHNFILLETGFILSVMLSLIQHLTFWSHVVRSPRIKYGAGFSGPGGQNRFLETCFGEE
jgi:hypothetical protein